MPKQTNTQAILRSGVAYGLGFAAGTLLVYFLFNNQVVDGLVNLLDPLQLFLRLLFAILLIFLFAGLGGGAGGAIGGWILSGLSAVDNRRRFMWYSALSFFVAHMVIVIPVLLLTAIVGFFNPDIDTTPTKLPALFAFYGLFYGAIAGLLLGWLTVGLRRVLGILLAAIFGFGLGGWFLGWGLYLVSQMESSGRLVTVLAICASMLLFGAAGGGTLGFAYQYVHSGRPLFPPTRGWRIVRNAIVAAIALVFLMAVGKLINTLTIRPATLSDTLPLPTVGTQWQAGQSSDTHLSTANEILGTLVDSQNRSVEVWCDDAGQVNVHVAGADIEQFALARCYNQPVLAEDSDGNIRLVWYSDEAAKVTGAMTTGHYLFESILSDAGWTEPAIIAHPAGVTQPTLSTTSNTLYLSWSDENGEQHATQIPYTCDDVPLTAIGQAVYATLRQETYRPTTDPIPYCQNRFDHLLYTPNATSPQNPEPASPNGAFDRVAQLVTKAEYEVLFTTMQWDAPSEKGSPGSTLAQAVAALYEQVRTDPAAYPRGMTVRILLGNVPDLAIFEPTGQIDHVLQDLHNAGVSEMVNADIGWRLEVANFDGAWPHAHSKFVVVDGKTAIAAGFNYSYLHLPTDHPSGKGLSMTDKGLQVSGPIAQAMMAAYDDLWHGSDQVNCSVFPPPIPALSFLWCKYSSAEVDHPPEALRFYPTDGTTNAFSLNHTSRILESDKAIIAAIEAAQESIRLYEVNFSLETVCVVAILLTDLCNTQDAIPPYMQALVKAMSENDVKVQAIVEPSGGNGLENRIAIRWLLGEMERLGKRQNIEIKFSDNKMHDKAFLIDDQLLVVGSQNFHWSAWDRPSLTENNIATESPDSITDFRQEFDYQWDIGKPVEEQMLPQ